MRVLLIVLAVINILGVVLSFFLTLAQSFWLAVLILFIGILEIIPIFALIRAIDDIETMQTELGYLRRELYQHIKVDNGEERKTETVYSPPAVNIQNVADKNWQCIKCTTVNKAGTGKCSNCGAPYDPELNPTE